MMNLAIRGIETNLGPSTPTAFHHDLHKDLKADYILANPPFNISDWGGERLRRRCRWQLRRPARGQRQLRLGSAFHLTISPPQASPASCSPTARMSSNQSGEGEIRKAIIEADLVDCMVALPGQLFYSTQIPVCLWFLATEQEERLASVIAAAKHCSSTPASSARSSTAFTAS